MMSHLRNFPSISSYVVLHQSEGNSYGLLINDLIADLPSILNIFVSTISDYIGMVGWGWWGATKWS